MADWPVQEGWVDMLDACLRDGPQVVTRNGQAAAVLVPLTDWEQARSIDPLLGPGPRFELEIPPRGTYRSRLERPIEFED